MKKTLLGFLCFIKINLIVLGQSMPDSALTSSFEDAVETRVEQGVEEIEDTQFEEELETYINHPLNLNKSTKEELISFPLFTEFQVDALIQHKQKFGDLISIEELQVVDGFDPQFIRRIRKFITLGNEAGKKVLNFHSLGNGKNSILIRFQRVLENQPGYINSSIDEDHYPGSKDKIIFKYKYELPGRIHAALIGEKDPGEEFLGTSHQSGFDFYSAHIQYKGYGIIKQVLVGDYSVQSGQGLTLWSGLGLGMSSDVTSIRKNPRGIVPYSSTDENSFLRGIAVSLGKNKIRTDLFYSTHSMDGNLVANDSTSIISSFQTSGYHRLPNEIEDRNAVNETIVGGLFSYSTSSTVIGGTFYQTQFSKSIEKELASYREFEFRGNKNLNFGIHYQRLYKNFFLFGEAARSMNGAFAVLQGFLIHLHPRLSTSLLVRKYEPGYQSLRSGAISENTSPSNEEGCFWGINLKLPKGITISSYIDVYHFPWLKYQVDAPSEGKEFLTQVNWVVGKTFESYVRYRQQNKMENDASGIDEMMHQLGQIEKENFRWHLRMKINDWLEWSSRIEWLKWEKEKSQTQNGELIYQDLLIHPMKSRITGSIRFAIFDCAGYEARIYAYENDVLFSYSIPAYQGKGNRYYLNLRYKILRGIDLWFRIARTCYANQTSIGEGLDKIEGNNKTEVKGEVRFQF